MAESCNSKELEYKRLLPVRRQDIVASLSPVAHQHLTLLFFHTFVFFQILLPNTFRVKHSKHSLVHSLL